MSEFDKKSIDRILYECEQEIKINRKDILERAKKKLYAISNYRATQEQIIKKQQILKEARNKKYD